MDWNRDKTGRVMNENCANYSVPLAQQLNNLRTFSSAPAFCQLIKQTAGLSRTRITQ